MTLYASFRRALAADLFEEWGSTIAAIAYGKYGGAARGNGARYAYGFAISLDSKARDQAATRRAVSTISTRAIVKIGAGTLAQVLDGKKHKASKWLAAQGVQLGSSSCRSGYG